MGGYRLGARCTLHLVRKRIVVVVVVSLLRWWYHCSSFRVFLDDTTMLNIQHGFNHLDMTEDKNWRKTRSLVTNHEW